jgi:Flp pilus assembly protein TadG
MFRQFCEDRRGNFAVIFALSMIPVLGLIGAAIDYTNASRLRSQIQEALDGAAVAGAKSAGRPAAEITQIATSFARANLPATLQNIPLTIDVLNDNTTVRIRPTSPVQVQTALLPVIGINTINVTVSAEATSGYQDLEIALALDNTGSMGGQKINVLRRAVSDFVRSMEALHSNSGRANSVRVGIVPFDTHVNMGRRYRNEPWMNFSMYSGNRNGWNGCVTDRDQPNDTRDTTPVAGQAATHFYADECDLADVAPLSSNWGQLQSTISQMRAAGWTNVPIGLVHGWHMLTPGEPYTEASAPRERLTKVLIVLTDGENTRNRWTSNRTSIDARMREVCANIKATGILIYTIRVIDGDANLLRNCASNPSMYFNVTAADQMNGVFQAIANQMSALRLSR